MKLAFDFKEEVTQTKRERERQIEANCSLSIEIFERALERARENQRETLAKFSRIRKKRKGMNFETGVPAK